MKKLFLILIAIAMFSCNKNEVKPIDYTVISGNIANNTAKNMEISNSDRSVRIQIPIDESGKFTDTLRVDKGIYLFYDGKNYNQLYIDKGEHLNISYDAKDFAKTLKYSGEGSAVSNYILAKNAKINEIMGKGREPYLLDEDTFKSKLKETKAAIIALINESKNLPKDFVESAKKEADYYYLNEIGKYEAYHSYYSKKPDFKVKDGFKKELESVDYTNENDFLNSPSYKELLIGHYNNLANEMEKKGGISFSMAMMKLASEIKSEKIKNSLLNSISYAIKYEDDMKGFYDQFMKVSTDEDAKKKLTETYNKVIKLSPGTDSPKFENYENYKGGTTSLDDLKGKYVYIDVWATWCGPCIAEIPSLKKLEKDYRGKKIHFVSISIDKKKDHEKWKKMVADKNLEGIQLYADNDWKSKFVQDYLIDGIPHFILIDPEGKIVKYSAPRPSDKKLTELFDELKI